MGAISIILNVDEHPPLRGVKTEDILRGEITCVCAIPEGMTSGKAAVGIVARTEDGRTIYIETSNKLFQLAAATIRAKYGEE